MTPDVVIDWLLVAFLGVLIVVPAVVVLILGIGGCIEWFDKRRTAQQTRQNRP